MDIIRRETGAKTNGMHNGAQPYLVGAIASPYPVPELSYTPTRLFKSNLY
jgi:hypothetical protein